MDDRNIICDDDEEEVDRLLPLSPGEDDDDQSGRALGNRKNQSSFNVQLPLQQRSIPRPRCLLPSCGIHRLALLSLILNVVLVIAIGRLWSWKPSVSPQTSSWRPPPPRPMQEAGNDTGNTTCSGYIPYDKVFGHVHMAKTAGTEINGELAAHFERVCGHKGYSYDFFQYNQRVEQSDSNHVNEVGGVDVISEVYNGFNRGRVKAQVMWEIGMEDCDVISLEASWQKWRNISRIWPLELHVPCRDPLDHFMSQCNDRRVVFDCQNKKQSLYQQIDDCLVQVEERFDFKLTKIPNTVMKCFQPIPIDGYLDYMTQFLQRKRIETQYIHRTTNESRDKSKECIWNFPDLANRILEILQTYDYYRWCGECMGSENDLLRGSGAGEDGGRPG